MEAEVCVYVCVCVGGGGGEPPSVNIQRLKFSLTS